LNNKDEFTIWIAKAFLDSDREPVQLAMIEAMADDAIAGEDLDKQLACVRSSGKEAGAFGLELAGAFVIPVLIELGKQLWSAYSEELMKQFGSDLADITSDKLKEWVKGQLNSKSENTVTIHMEAAIRQLGETHDLSQDQISELIAVVRQGDVKKRLDED
jgi:predicted transcriptional regulator